MVTANTNSFKKILIIGDRVLVKALMPDEKTSSGLYLPSGVIQQEKVGKGYVIKTGPGYAIPSRFEDEPWKTDDESVKYIPIQAKEGDLVLYLINQAMHITYRDEKYYIVPHNALLLIEREEDF